MKKKGVLGIVGLMALSLSGCKKDDNIRVGIECGYAPYLWQLPSPVETSIKSKYSPIYCDGYDAVIIKALEKEIEDVKFSFYEYDFDSMLSQVSSGNLDMAIAGIGPTELRRQSMDFSNSYYDVGQTILVNRNGNYVSAKKLADFDGAKFSAQEGTLQASLIDQVIDATNGTAIKGNTLPNYGALANALNSNTIDAFIADVPVATKIAAANPSIIALDIDADGGFTVDEEEGRNVIAIKKGNIDLLTKVNDALAKISLEQREQWMAEAMERSGEL